MIAFIIDIAAIMAVPRYKMISPVRVYSVFSEVIGSVETTLPYFCAPRLPEISPVGRIFIDIPVFALRIIDTLFSMARIMA